MQAAGFAQGLHLCNQFGVGPLGLDQGGDRTFFAARVAGDKAPRQIAFAQSAPVEFFDGVFLDQKPLVTALAQSLDVTVADIRVVGQVHFGRRKPPHAALR